VAIEDIVVASFAELCALVVNVAVRLFGLPEDTAKIIVARLWYFIVFVLISGLFFITFKYS
jgi:hypothetical protein